MAKFWRLIIISRPIFWIIFSGVFAYGVIVAGNYWHLATFLCLLYFTLPMGVIVFGLNDISDRKSDALNPRKGSLDGAVIKDREVKWVSYWVIFWSVLPLVWLGLLGYYRTALMFAAITAFAYVYSFKPVRLKSIPIIDSLSNGVWMALIFLSGYFLGATSFSLSSQAVNLMLVLGLNAAAFHALGTMLDYEVDKKAGDRTIGILLGKRLVTGLSALVLTACFLLVDTEFIELKIFYAVVAGMCLVGAIYFQPRMVASLKKTAHWISLIPLAGIHLIIR